MSLRTALPKARRLAAFLFALTGHWFTSWQLGVEQHSRAAAAFSRPPLPLQPATHLPPPAVNWHLEPRCNFACEFCYAHFYEAGKRPDRLDLRVSFDILAQLVDAGAQKITFVGGEPLLHPHIRQLVERAKQLGLTTCIVTNGSLLSSAWLESMRRHLDWLGISIDASTDALHLQIGRASMTDRRRNASSHLEHLERMWAVARGLGYGLKLNTVVSRPTLHSDMGDLVLRLRPDRWKAFQVLRIEGENDDTFDAYEISRSEFDEWVERHRRKVEPHQIELVAESNADMRGTYAMMDWQGRFYSNAGGSYEHSGSAAELGVKPAWAQVVGGFDFESFDSRGGVWDWQGE